VSVARSIVPALAPSVSGTSVTDSAVVAVSELRFISVTPAPASMPLGFPHRKMSPRESTPTLRWSPLTSKLAISAPVDEYSRTAPAASSLTYTSPLASVATPLGSTNGVDPPVSCDSYWNSSPTGSKRSTTLWCSSEGSLSGSTT
jgi:hypothetical protein